MSSGTTIVETEPGKSIIRNSSWPKKQLADVHLEALQFCQFGCQYCSSNAGLHLRFQKHTLNTLLQATTGHGFDPHDAADITIVYHHIVQALDSELSAMRQKPGASKTLVYSQLTDGFSPVLLGTGTARQILDLLIQKTNYRIRVLTKNAVVGNRQWVRYFSQHADRFVVGLSIGSLDGNFTRQMERGTSRPDSRVAALRKLQDAGVPTYGMLCPTFPQVLDSDELERLLECICPELCEHVWAEPYNERHNWRFVRDVYGKDSGMWRWMTKVYQNHDQALWSGYATELYSRIYERAESGGWADKLRYLLYEDGIVAADAQHFSGLNGVLLQCKAGEDGKSRNPYIAALQA